jgi:hypothetical protein
MKMIQACEHPWEWVQKADGLYVAARFLYWKGFPLEFAVLGAHAIELYLKAFLIQRTNKYIANHNLGIIYQVCMALDDFFKDEALAGNFLRLPMPNSPEKWTHNPMSHLTWTEYTNNLRYPESLPNQPPRKGVVIPMGYSDCVRGGTCWSLDCIADFVKKHVSPLEGKRDVIDNLLYGTGDVWQVSDDLQEIRELVLRGNQALLNKTK